MVALFFVYIVVYCAKLVLSVPKMYIKKLFFKDFISGGVNFRKLFYIFVD